MAVDPTYPQVGQTMDVGHGESASGANPVIQLQNGQMVQATQIGKRPFVNDLLALGLGPRPRMTS